MRPDGPDKITDAPFVEHHGLAVVVIHVEEETHGVDTRLHGEDLGSRRLEHLLVRHALHLARGHVVKHDFKHHDRVDVERVVREALVVQREDAEDRRAAALILECDEGIVVVRVLRPAGRKLHPEAQRLDDSRRGDRELFTGGLYATVRPVYPQKHTKRRRIYERPKRDLGRKRRRYEYRFCRSFLHDVTCLRIELRVVRIAR